MIDFIRAWVTFNTTAIGFPMVPFLEMIRDWLLLPFLFFLTIDYSFLPFMLC